MPGSLSLVAGGNITPSSFLTLTGGGGDRSVVVAGAGSRICAISKEWQRLVPWESLPDGNIAIAGDSVANWAPGFDEEAYLQLGGTVNVGDYVKSDSSGHGVTAGSDGDEYGALALEAGVSGSIVKVRPQCGMRGA